VGTVTVSASGVEEQKGSDSVSDSGSVSSNKKQAPEVSSGVVLNTSISLAEPSQLTLDTNTNTNTHTETHTERDVHTVATTATSYTPRLPDASFLTKKGFVLPSKRLRSLEGTHTYPDRNYKVAGLAKSFGLRRARAEAGEVKLARDLMSYLRLQPYTGRPCLGLMHMARKSEYASKIVMRSLWFRDLARQRPSMWVNEVSERLRYICHSMAQTKMRVCLNHFEVQVTGIADDSNEQSLSLMIPTSQLIHTLASTQPLILASMLCCMITNNFPDIVEHDSIFDYIDIQLPGSGLDSRSLSGYKKLWRLPFYSETPRLTYLHNLGQRYRGPIYKIHRFIAGRYFEVSFSLSNTRDIRILLKKPKNGLFASHKYRGQRMILDLTSSQLRALVCKLACMPALTPDTYLGTLNYLHPNYYHDFFPLLLDLLFIDLDKTSHTFHSTVDYRVEKESNTDKLQREIQLLIQKFNHWVRDKTQLIYYF
jgi:hypothetical protein